MRDFVWICNSKVDILVSKLKDQTFDLTIAGKKFREKEELNIWCDISEVKVTMERNDRTMRLSDLRTLIIFKVDLILRVTNINVVIFQA
jgi:hypothetical protein